MNLTISDGLTALLLTWLPVNDWMKPELLPSERSSHPVPSLLSLLAASRWMLPARPRTGKSASHDFVNPTLSEEIFDFFFSCMSCIHVCMYVRMYVWLVR